MPDDHLSRLLLTDSGQPFYRSLVQSFKELIAPPRLPPLEVTSQPVAVKDIWGQYGRQKKSFLMSAAVQAVALILIFTLLSSKTVQRRVRQTVQLIIPAEVNVLKPVAHAGGGGGGDRSPLPASKGKLPKPALRQFVPPSAVINNPQPKLAMDVSILAPPDAMPNVNMANYGDPLGKLGPASNGTGSGGGIGSGKGGGVGSGNGGGAGQGSGGGFAYTPGRGGVTFPRVIHQEDPEYSDDARKAHFSGQVVVYIEVDASGKVINPHIVRSVGLGLDEKALESVLKWTFHPGTLNGKPVTTSAAIYMTFHLL
jgi:TonB family protein